MAEQVQITLFTFDELPEDSQQKLIEGFRQDYDPDYSHVYDEFIIDMSEQYGADIKEDNIQWSGFWSQGDGACFTCNFDEEVIFPILKQELSEDDVAYIEKQGVRLDAKSVRTGFSNLYSHENTVEAELYLYSDSDDTMDEAREMLENKLTEIIRQSCRDLYQRLEDYYNEETEDEAIKQRIKEFWPGCNFRKDGTIFAR
jgi:hypothetical protein